MGVSAGVAVGLVGSYMSSESAKKAAATQAESGRAALTTQEKMLLQQQAVEQPFVAAGQTALDQLLAGLQPGGQFATPLSAAFTPQENQAQKFVTAEALAKMRDQMALGGQQLSTNAIVGAGKLAGDIASQYENQAYNQWLQTRQSALAERQAQLQPLQNVVSLGQAAASGTAANLGAAGANISSLQQGIGNVQAAGQIGGTAPYGQTMSDIGSLLLAQGLKPQTQPTTEPGFSGQTTTVKTTQGYDPATGTYR